MCRHVGKVNKKLKALKTVVIPCGKSRIDHPYLCMEKTMETITVHALFGKAMLKDIAIDQLHSGTYQPRDTFSEESLASLATTIEQLGILEPLIVRLSSKHAGQYEIVAGERRYRAAKLAGLTVVPCLLSNYTNEQAAQIAVIENTCRESLNPIAEAFAMRRLASEFNYTHHEIGVLLGMSRTRVTNMLRLLNLDARIQHWMKQGHLSEGHGKILAGLPLTKQYWFAYECIKKEWSVGTLDDAIKALDEKKRDSSNARKSSAIASPIEKQLTEQFGFSMKATINKNESGSFRIPFHNREHMHTILEKLGCQSIALETQD
jgi:ParB family chromosome partitioning protein